LPYKYSTTTPAREEERRGEKEGEAERINKGKERTTRTEERKTDQRRKENRESHKHERDWRVRREGKLTEREKKEPTERDS
jgi:hypothetical protein